MIKRNLQFYHYNANSVHLNILLDFLKPSESNYIRPMAFMPMGP